jgi:6-phosphogluconolactonase (cycloisomerase 2 family)
VPGTPTDITVSPDQNWLAVIYNAAGAAHVAVFSIDNYGDLNLAAISPAVGAAQFSGVAISQ